MFYYINKELAVVLVVVDNECTAQIMYIFTCIVVLIYFTHINSRHSKNVIYSNFTHGVLVLFKCLLHPYSIQYLKSLGPIDRKFHGHGENDGFVLYGYLIKQFSSFCKYTNISVMKKTCEIK